MQGEPWARRHLSTACDPRDRPPGAVILGRGWALTPGMKVRLTLRPGDNGTKKYHARYGQRLVCVRYRYDAARKLRFTTVELIVDQNRWDERDPGAQTRVPRPGDMVGVRIGYQETDLRALAKESGAIWRPRQRLWEMPFATAAKLGLGARIVLPD